MIKHSDIVNLYEENPFWDNMNSIYDKLIYIRKTEKTDEKVLLILPCNAGASKGNYFEAGTFPYLNNNWRKADKWLRNLRTDIYIAAHSSVEFYFPDGNGAFVFEHENHRVCSSDDKGVPVMSEFSYYDQNLFYIPKMVNDLKKGFDRALNQYNFEKIIIIETPLAYKTSMAKAINDLGIHEQVTMIDSRVGTVDFFLKMINVILYKDLSGILYHPNFSYKFSEKCEIPDEYRYDKYDYYKNILDYVDLIRINGHDFSHLLPVYKKDSDKTLSELIEIYKLPYKTPLYKI